MSQKTVPQLNRTIEEINRFFKEKSAEFCTTINKVEGRFTQEDYQQFTTVVESIREYAVSSINNFFQRKVSERSETYDSTILDFSERSSQTLNQLKDFRYQLERSTVQLKINQQKKEKLLEHFSVKYSSNCLIKKVWKRLKQNAEEQCLQRKVNAEATNVYQKNLLKKVFFPWRQLTYRQGYENTVKRETSEDIMQIHAQYQSIVDILKEKISDTNDMIKIKKAAKGEFSYALSKNLLKTISNLSMEVMSLNQISLNDNEVEQSQTRNFMQEIDDIITLKLKKVRDFKKSLCENEESADKKKKKITFV